MKRAVFLYGGVIAGAGLVLQWLENLYLVRALSTQVFMAAIAVGFAVLGAWVGHCLTSGPPSPGFERNAQAVGSLGISGRELEVLDLLADGYSNQEIAERLFVSRHTVKTHLSHLYGKLDVSRRMQAVRKARQLRILP